MMSWFSSLVKRKRRVKSVVGSSSFWDTSEESCSFPGPFERGARTILRRHPGPRSQRRGACSSGKLGAARILVTKSWVLNPRVAETRSLRDHMGAAVKDSGPGFLVVEFADVAARYSKARCVKLPRMPFSNSPAWQQSKMTSTSARVLLIMCSVESQIIS